MANIKFHGQAVSTIGDLPAVGTDAPQFRLIDKDLNVITLDNFIEKKIVLNIVPSLDTTVCALSEKTFKSRIKDDTVIITVSRDTPFVFKRIEEDSPAQENAISAADMSHEFGDAYQCTLSSSPLKYLLSRAVIIIDKDKKIVYTEQVEEITHHPNYDAALESLEKI